MGSYYTDLGYVFNLRKVYAMVDDSIDESFIDEFIAECSDMIDEIEPQMAAAASLSKPLATALFRPVHSIKGVSASLGFEKFSHVVHEAENLLCMFTSHNYESEDRKYLDFFLHFFDFVRKSFDIIREEKSDANCMQDGEPLIADAAKLKNDLSAEKMAATSPPSAATNLTIEIDEPVTPPTVQEGQDSNSDSEPEERIELGQEMVDAFVAESLDAFSIVEDKLLSLSKELDNKENIHEVYRLLHSFKGNCGIFGLGNLETFSHRIESLLQSILGGKVTATENIINSLIPMVDVIKNIVIGIKTGGSGEVNNLDLYLEMLDSFLSTGSLVQENKVEESVEVASVPAPSAASPSAPAKTTPPSITAAKAEAKAQTQVAAVANPKVASIDRQDIRVDIAKLDILNNLVGELVTAKNMVAEEMFTTPPNIESMQKTLRFLERITNDLQDVAMNIRMIPVSGLFKKMIRIVHDISIKSGKEVNFKFFGEDTEIDKTVIEKIGDPLVHMIRNAVDHGIEPLEKRAENGKPRAGQVTLTAKNEAGEIWIILKDDGRGLNKEKILEKAIAQGLVQGDGSNLTDKQIFDFIFAAGFSTAEKVTDISGRGVGMDVVRQNIQAIKGRVDIQSVIGEGTTFTIKIPLTLAIIQGMLLQVGRLKYTVPIENIRETVKITDEIITHPVEDHELIKIRDQMIPIFRLSKLHNIPDAVSDLGEGLLVIIENRGFVMALLIDQILGQHETVVKPLPKFFKALNGVSGCSILGNGEASLILDVGTLIDFMQKKVSAL